jgi:hypothetical protein
MCMEFNRVSSPSPPWWFHSTSSGHSTNFSKADAGFGLPGYPLAQIEPKLDALDFVNVCPIPKPSEIGDPYASNAQLKLHLGDEF